MKPVSCNQEMGGAQALCPGTPPGMHSIPNSMGTETPVPRIILGRPCPEYTFLCFFIYIIFSTL